MNTRFTTALTSAGGASVPVCRFALVVSLCALFPQHAAAQSFTFTSLYSFFGADGQQPASNLVEGGDGNFYGTTVFGGNQSTGTVYRITPAGVEDVLHSFGSVAQDGSFPNRLLQASDGSFYGTTQNGGISNLGTAFKLTPDGTYTLLHSFGGGSTGAVPAPGTALVEALGEFYGVAGGGSTGFGTFFAMNPAGAVVVLHDFASPGGADGSEPIGTPILASDGNIYGTTFLGGPNNAGVIYKIAPPPIFINETIFYTFKGGTTDGKGPTVLIQASDGNFYGITQNGGASNNGTVFRLTPSRTETVLHSFAGGTADGAAPSDLVQGADGNLYGTCRLGGAHGHGMAFRLTTTGVETVLYSFAGGSGDGDAPNGLLQDSDGHFYGTASVGGPTNEGVVFRLTSNGTETLLHSFPVNSGIQFQGRASAGLLRASDGNLYGVTVSGGTSNEGVVYRLTPDGDQSIVYSFSGSPDGTNPIGPLVHDGTGNLYGVTNHGGTSNTGTIFKVTTSGVETVLHSFTGVDGAFPLCGLTVGSDGNFYGAVFEGGSTGHGTIYKITPTGAFTLLYTFKGAPSDGNAPNVLMGASEGNFYGTTLEGGAFNEGTIFKVTPTGVETPIYSFSFTGQDGGLPVGGLVQGEDGNLYGTSGFGANGVTSTNPGFGSVFKITTAGVLTTLHAFTGPPTDGESSQATLVQGLDGNFYGTTVVGGADNFGSIFEVSPADGERLLHSFTGADGNFPVGQLLLLSDGNFYGTTVMGGADNDGSIFVLTPVAATLTSLSPASAHAGGPAFALTVSGSNFDSGGVVQWKGKPLTTTFVSTSQLTASVPASLIAKPGTVKVTVKQEGVTSNALAFTIRDWPLLQKFEEKDGR